MIRRRTAGRLAAVVLHWFFFRRLAAIVPRSGRVRVLPSAAGAHAHRLITPDHLGRAAVVSVRQSTGTDVMGLLDRQRRPYDLAQAAAGAGFASVTAINDSLGRSDSGSSRRPGFKRPPSRMSATAHRWWMPFFHCFMNILTEGLALCESGIISLHGADAGERLLPLFRYGGVVQYGEPVDRRLHHLQLALRRQSSD
jgi:hypothetical protein